MLINKIVLSSIPDDPSLEVTTEKLLHGKSLYHPDGLYSERIFGPSHDYICSCGIYKTDGSVCEKCGVKHISSESRSTTIGFIRLPFKIFNPLMSIASASLKSEFKAILKWNRYVWRNEDDELIISSSPENSNYANGVEALSIIYEWLNSNPDKGKDIFSDKELSLLNKFKNNYYIDRLPVLPPALRPVFFKSNSMHVTERITKLYMTLLKKKKIFKENIFIDINDEVSLKSKKQIQYICDYIYKEVMNYLGSKKGIIRHNILGKRQDYSGRAVITVDPSLKYNECRIPYMILLEVYKYEFAHYLSKLKNESYRSMYESINDSIEKGDYRYLDEISEYVKDKQTILNRQPTLHQYGLLSENTLVSTDNTVKIHPMLCAPTGGDFDGDSVLGRILVILDDKEKYKDIVKATDLKIDNRTVYSVDIKDIPYIKETEKKMYNDNPIYKVPDGIYAVTIDNKTLIPSLYKITEFSIHHNCKSYDVTLSDNSTISVSDSHSMIVYDDDLKMCVETSPKYSIDKRIPKINNNGELEWLTVKRMVYTGEKTMYDITVPGPYTFSMDNGVIVQDSMNGCISLEYDGHFHKIHMSELLNLRIN